jgi:hypothetical protein
VAGGKREEPAAGTEDCGEGTCARDFARGEHEGGGVGRGTAATKGKG